MPVVYRKKSRVAFLALVALGLSPLSAIADGSALTVDPSTTWRASVPNGGVGEPDGASSFGSISSDGRYVAFQSSATNLVQNDTNGPLIPAVGVCLTSAVPTCQDNEWYRATRLGRDVFVHDRTTRETTRVSVASDGSQSHLAISTSMYPSISWDGQRISFTSSAPDLVPGGQPGNAIYVHDLRTQETQLVSVSTTGGFATGYVSAISGNGRFVAFESGSPNLVADDTNGVTDFFVRDLQEGTTKRVTVASDGTQANFWNFGTPAISYDGRFIAYSSMASNLVPGDTNEENDVFIHDQLLGTTKRVSVGTNSQQGDNASSTPGISADGSVVAFKSWATNFNPEDKNGTADVYARDLTTGATTMISVSSTGEQANGATVIDDIANNQAVSADGRYVVMLSWATNLGPGANSVLPDVFVHDRHTAETWRASVNQAGLIGPSVTRRQAISADGNHVMFSGTAPTLVLGALNPRGDVLVRSRNIGICAPTQTECLLDR